MLYIVRMRKGKYKSEINLLAEYYSTFVNKSERKIEQDTLKQYMSVNFRKFKFREFLPNLSPS